MKLGLTLQVVELPASTRTAAEIAAVIGCSVRQIAKSLVFETQSSGKAVLVIASGRACAGGLQSGQILCMVGISRRSRQRLEPQTLKVSFASEIAFQA